MTLAAHVYAAGMFDFYVSFGETHLKSDDGTRCMRSELVNPLTLNAWPRGIFEGWPLA